MKTVSREIFSLIFCVSLFSVMRGQVPVLNSNPSASATIFLDFDGQYVTGTSWNWNGAINAQPSGLSTTAITEIFNRVSEDFRPFNVNLTTDSTVYILSPTNKRTRVIVTTSSAWYGRAGGVAFVGSFSWGDDTPAWVFSALLSNNTKNVAEAISHEAGHTLGLQHQSTFNASCGKLQEYSEGQGAGEIGWAPIMGVGYYKNLTTWHLGPNTGGCNNIQNDLDIIAGPANNFGFRADDHGNSSSTSTFVNMQGYNFLVSGVINSSQDVDAFKVELTSPTVLKLNAIPRNVGYGNQGANIDIKLTIQNATFDTIGQYNPSDLLNAGIDTNLNNGLYYITVRGTGNLNHSSYGSLGFYSLIGSQESILRFDNFLLKGNSNNGNHVLSWTYSSDEALKSIIVESSSDGKNFKPLMALNENVKNFSYKPVNSTNFYRVKSLTRERERVYYSNIISIYNSNKDEDIKLLYTIVKDNMQLRSTGVCAYQVFSNSGEMFGSGYLQGGINNIDISGVSKGMFYIRIINGATSKTQKFIKQ